MMFSSTIKDKCRVDHLATMAGQIIAQFSEKRTDTMVALLNPIEEGAAHMQASTPRAALFQLLLAAADLSELASTAKWDSETLRRRHERIEACVISALNVFERECGLDRNELGGSYFARSGYTPQAWQRLAAAAAAI